jgi:hypothetical protein
VANSAKQIFVQRNKKQILKSDRLDQLKKMSKWDDFRERRDLAKEAYVKAKRKWVQVALF